jgi:hypothetical protein
MMINIIHAKDLKPISKEELSQKELELFKHIIMNGILIAVRNGFYNHKAFVNKYNNLPNDYFDKVKETFELHGYEVRRTEDPLCLAISWPKSK